MAAATITPKAYTITEEDANKIYDGYHKHCITQLTEEIYGVGVVDDVKESLKKIAPEKTKAYEDATKKSEALDTAITIVTLLMIMMVIIRML